MVKEFKREEKFWASEEWGINYQRRNSDNKFPLDVNMQHLLKQNLNNE